jgi:hypothetical protein
MVRTSAPGSVAGAFVDRDPATSTPGTDVVAADQNNHQEEICHAIENAGLTLSGADQEQLYKAIVALSHSVGEFLFSAIARAASTDFPAVRLDEADQTIAAANYPQLVTALRGEKLSVSGVSSWSCTVSGSTVTFPSTTPAAQLLADLYEDAKVHGGGGETASYTNWLTLNIGGTDYAITGIVPLSYTVTVSGSPATGSQTVMCYPFRIAGSSTTARLRKTSGRSLVSGGDDDGECIQGLRRRDRGQSHRHRPTDYVSQAYAFATVPGTGYVTAYNGPSVDNAPDTGAPKVDGSYGTPRAGKTTDPRGMIGYLYLWAGLYVA